MIIEMILKTGGKVYYDANSLDMRGDKIIVYHGLLSSEIRKDEIKKIWKDSVKIYGGR